MSIASRVALAGVLVLAGCASASTPEPTVLVIREARGGLCASGAECRTVFTVLSDGSWTTGGDTTHRSGHLDTGTLDALQAAAAASGLAAAPLFTGTCPREYDGQEISYTWTARGHTSRASSCERQFVASDPLVIAVEAAYSGTG